MKRGTILTIGYGNRQFDVFLELLLREQVEYLIDVRSYPSGWNEAYNKVNLSASLGEQDIRYLFMGDVLGGRPKDDSAYEGGILSYARTAELTQTKEGIARILAAAKGGYRACVMCSELRPEECHRCKLVAQQVSLHGATVLHVDGDGELVTHGEVMNRIPEDLIDRPVKMFRR